jgi:hypothetical protein
MTRAKIWPLLAAVLLLGACGSSRPASGAPDVSVEASPTSAAVPTMPTASSLVAPSPSGTPTPSALLPVTSAWGGLRWSAPSVFSDAGFIATVVAFDGQLVAAGQSQAAGGSDEVAFWRSADGTTWTPLERGGATFADARVTSIVATPTGLVAWGSVGQPACSGQGEGQTTCPPAPAPAPPPPDGISWARIAGATMFAGASISAVAVGPQGLVAVGDTGWATPAIWLSATGTRWQRLVLPSAVFAGAHFSDVRATASGYVLAGGTGTQLVTVTGGPKGNASVVAAAWWSGDGRMWTKATVHRAGGAGSNLGLVFVGDDGMVATGSASGGQESVAWTSADGRSWQPIVPGYFGAPPASPGVPTLPSFTISDDGTHLVAVGVADQLALRMWTSSDGVAWLPLSFSGATDTVPAWPGDPSRPTIDRAFVVPDGLVVIGYPGASAQLPVWHVTALPPLAQQPSGVPAAVPVASEAPVPALTVDHPRVIVTPSSGLKDGETVQVQVTGFGVGGKVWLSECASASAATNLGCGAQLAAQTFLVTDDSRAGRTGFTVHALAPVRPLLATPAATCADQCVLVATLGAGAYVVAPIRFSSP